MPNAPKPTTGSTDPTATLDNGGGHVVQSGNQDGTSLFGSDRQEAFLLGWLSAVNPLVHRLAGRAFSLAVQDHDGSCGMALRAAGHHLNEAARLLAPMAIALDPDIDSMGRGKAWAAMNRLIARGRQVQ